MTKTTFASPYRIVIIVPYFGNKPWYFDFFLKSCSYNNTIHFLLFTDWADLTELPSNVTAIQSSLAAIKKLAAEQLGFPVSLESNYKLCDFRPAFGVIFSGYIKEYHFWGYCDIDLIFGNIRHFITDELLEFSDLISVRREYVTGFFALYRNNEAVRQLFKESADYLKVFQDHMHYCFDECNFNHKPLVNGLSIFQVRAEIQSMTYVVKKQAVCGVIKPVFENMIVEDSFGKLEWDHGVLRYNTQYPALLYHLIYFKALPYIKIPAWNKIPNRLYIWSFFLSAYRQGSIRGSITWVWNSMLRLVKLSSLQTMKYLDLVMKSVLSSRKIKQGIELEMNDILGYYKDENVTIHIEFICGRLCASWELDSRKNRVFFFHRSNNLFIIRRFRGEVNVDIEFGYDHTLAVQSICVKPFRKGKFYLYKINK